MSGFEGVCNKYEWKGYGGRGERIWRVILFLEDKVE